MIRDIACLATAAIVSISGCRARGQPIRSTEADPGPVTTELLSKANCSKVLPRLIEQAAPLGLTLVPEESEGSFESATGVCLGAVEGAIVQRDAADKRGRAADCVGKYDDVGAPLYPYYAFVVIAATNRADSLGELVDRVPEGRTVNVAAGALGSGGPITLDYILRANPAWKRAINVSTFGVDTALRRVTDGGLDAFFVMDALDSDLLETIRSSTDKNGRPMYKFLDLRPGKAFFDIRDWSGRRLFQQVVLEGGLFSSTKTVSVDAIVIVNNAFREDRQKGGPLAIERLATAIDHAQAAIMADTKTPRDWRPSISQK